MSANDKVQATFHGEDLTEREIRERRLAELEAARESQMLEEEIAAEGRWPIEPGEIVELSPDNGIAGIPDSLMLNAGLEILIQQSGQNSKDHGFHEGFPSPDDSLQSEIGLAITQKLTLMMEEIIEAFGEIRDGRSPYETYFVDKKGLIGEKGDEYAEQHYDLSNETPVPLLKPEGFLVEIADLFIRGADLIFLLKCPEEFLHALNIKHEYNKTRPFKHGRQF